jgi:two-component system sensor histidine kinase PrrB
LRLAHRIGLAALVAASLALLTIALLFRTQANRILINRVDAQLTERSATAPILAAVGPRLARSELSATVQPARIFTTVADDTEAHDTGTHDTGTDGTGTHGTGTHDTETHDTETHDTGTDGTGLSYIVEVGPVPDDPLPVPTGPGLSTARADGQRWRMLTIEVIDVPEVGDRALVQLVTPLGDVDVESRRLRRRATTVGLLAALGAGLAGSVLGLVASRPITALGRDTERLSGRDPGRWRVADRYGTPEVDQVAAALNTTLGRLAAETERRGEALASARSFAAAASHELRVPLQSTLANLNLATDPRLPEAERHQVLAAATDQLHRMADALGAVRAVTEAELADPSWFEPVDLIELVDATITEEGRRHGAAVTLQVTDGAGSDQQGRQAVWADGVRLAIANVVRNAFVHGRSADRPGRMPQVVVTVDPAASTVIVDDDGPGFPPGDDRRDRLLGRFERRSDKPGSGLGLSIADQVAAAHHGSVRLTDSPLGGARVVVRLTPEPDPGPAEPD